MNTVKDDFGSIEITHASSKFTQTLNLDRKTKRQFVDEYYELFKAPNEIRIKAAFLSNISLLDHPPCGIKIKEENWGNKVKRFVSGYGINTPPGYPSCIFKAKNQIAEISEQMTTEADAFNLSQTRSFTPTCLPDQHRTTMTWEHFLPKGFETRELVKEFRRKTINGLANCDEIGNRPEIVLGICKKGRRCQSSLCPICHRLLRREFVKLVVEYQLYQLNWSLLTVRINDWIMQAGDHRRFVDFMGSRKERIKDIPVFQNLMQRYRRAFNGSEHQGRLFIIGSVETVYRVVGNKPTNKPFHVHLIVSGLPKQEIERIANKLFASQRNAGPLHPIHVRTVNSTQEDFVKLLTYCVAQPFVKQNYVNEDTKKGRMQRPKPKEFAELACNLGQGKLSDRLLLTGLKIEHGKPKLISK